MERPQRLRMPRACCAAGAVSRPFALSTISVFCYSRVQKEMDRRVEDFARRLMEQQIDPRQAGIDWEAFRDSQRDVAREGIAAALVLDEITRREHLEVTDEELENEVRRYAERTGRAPAAVRAALEKEGGLSRVAAGLRREKSIDFVMSRATIAGNP